MARRLALGCATAALLCLVTGPTLGFALIFTDISLYLINAIGALVFALLVPFIAIGRTLLYFDLQLQAEEEPAKRWRDRLARRGAHGDGRGLRPARGLRAG